MLPFLAESLHTHDLRKAQGRICTVTATCSLQEQQLSLPPWNNSNAVTEQHCNSGVCTAQFRQRSSVTKMNALHL